MSSILQAAKTIDRGGSMDMDAGTSLARDLIFKVAKVDHSAIEDLFNALRNGNDGHANGLMQKINEHLDAIRCL
jgi:hypothetical protein